MITREEKREQTVNKFANNNFSGIANWATGVGKTNLAIDIIRRIEKLGKASYILITPSPGLNQQWKDRLKIFPKHLLERILIKTPEQILNYDIKYNIDCLIIDELHEFSSLERLQLLDKSIINNNYFIGLTASGNSNNFFKILKYYKILDIVTLEEAKRNKWISDVKEYNLPVELTEKERVLYDKLSTTITNYFPKFNNDIDLATKVISGGKDRWGIYYSGLKYAVALARKNNWSENLNLNNINDKLIDDEWNPNTIIGYARMLTTAIRVRKELLYSASNKLDILLKLVNKFNKIKTLIFTESTDWADKAGTLLNNNKHLTSVYHSNLKTIMVTSEKSGKLLKKGKVRLKKEAIENIKTGKVRILVTGKSFDRGLDIPDIRFIITASGTQSFVQKEQRDGRGIRKEEHIDLPVLFVNLYVINTQEEKWLKNRLKYNNNTIFVNNIEEIDYTPPANIEFNTLNL